MGPRTHADEFIDIEDHPQKDFDPEDDQQDFDDSESAGSEDDDGDTLGREHYQSVGKSKLRTGEVVTLGPSYQGFRVSRKKISEQAEEHDPFEGYDSDEAEDENEVDDDEHNDEQEEEDDDDDEEEEDGGDGTDTDNTSLGDDEEASSIQDDRAQLRALMSDSRKAVAESITSAATADAVKGRAVKVQRQTFDSLLNSRIRLQHSLIASNTMAVTARSFEEADKSIYEGAENAALNLFKTLSSLRDALPSQRAGEKRKRPSIAAATPTSLLWSHLKQQDTTSQAYQRTVLQKWSQKTASATTTAAQTSNKLNPTAQTTLLDVLDSHLGPTSIPRHIERTRVPRSCAPVQQKRPRQSQNADSMAGSAGQEQSPDGGDIYDDADFYGILLKELLEARSANAAVDYSIAAANAANGGMEDEYRAARQAKSHSRPGADRKASKGRKMRYTVHEKLQNFMAPEDRGTWEQRQREELFGSLFGRQLQLVEDDEHDDTNGNENAEEEALVLFRS